MAAMRLLPSTTKPSRSTDSPKVEPRFPSLFGRLSILLDAHERHRATLEGLKEMCNAIEVGRSLPESLEPRQLLRDLRRELSAHFAAEEQRAHYRTIPGTRPDLLPRVVDLKTDHLRLLQVMRHLEMMAAETTGWSTLPALVSSLLDALADHERAEAELVEELRSTTDGAPERSEVRTLQPGEAGARVELRSAAP